MFTFFKNFTSQLAEPVFSGEVFGILPFQSLFHGRQGSRLWAAASHGAACPLPSRSARPASATPAAASPARTAPSPARSRAGPCGPRRGGRGRAYLRLRATLGALDGAEREAARLHVPVVPCEPGTAGKRQSIRLLSRSGRGKRLSFDDLPAGLFRAASTRHACRIAHPGRIFARRTGGINQTP